METAMLGLVAFMAAGNAVVLTTLLDNPWFRWPLRVIAAPCAVIGLVVVAIGMRRMGAW
jgi:hypothetical protein